MRTRATLLVTALLTGGALASPALAAKPEPAEPLPTRTVNACGSTLLIEEVRSNAKQTVTEGDTSIRVVARGNGIIRVTDTVTGEAIELRAPGRSVFEGSFDPATNTATGRVELSGITILLPEPYSFPAEVEAQRAFGLPEFAIVYGRFIGVATGPAEAMGPTTAQVIKAGNRVVDVCDLLA